MSKIVGAYFNIFPYTHWEIINAKWNQNLEHGGMLGGIIDIKQYLPPRSRSRMILEISLELFAFVFIRRCAEAFNILLR